MAENLENTQGQNNESGTEEKEQNGKFYTEEEIQMLLQKEGDRRVSQLQKTLEKRQREANKLKNMSDTERTEYELNQRELELEERENKLILAENKAACLSVLVDKGLDASLVDFVVDTDADTMNDKIKKLEKAFKKSVKDEVEKRLAGSAPKKNLGTDETMKKADLLKMSARDLQIFKTQNPDEYRRIMKG